MRPLSVALLIVSVGGCGGSGAPTGPSSYAPTLSFEMTLRTGHASTVERATPGPRGNRAAIRYVGCGDYVVTGPLTLSVTAELLGPDGAVYATVPPEREVTPLGGFIGGCSNELSGVMDYSFEHPLASRVRFVVTYRDAHLPNGPTQVTRAETSIDTRGASIPQRLLIEQFRPFGPNGASDQFIELFNDSLSPATVPERVAIAVNDVTSGTEIAVTPTVGPLCHFLIAARGYSGGTRPDLSIPIGLPNDGSVHLAPVGFTEYVYGDHVSMNTTYNSGEGTTLQPFDATTSDRSYARRGPDTDDNAISS